MSGINSDVILMIKGDVAGGNPWNAAYGPPLSVASGAVAISAIASAFGGGAFYFDGLSTTGLKWVNQASLEFWTSNYTIDWRMRNDPTYSMATIRFFTVGSTNDRYHIMLMSNAVRLYLASAGTVILSYTAAYDWGSNSILTHFAVTQNTSVVRVFASGTLIGSTVTGSLSNIKAANTYSYATLGTLQYATGVSAFKGYIEEFRITKGVALWTADFTPPTEQYTYDLPVTTMQTVASTAAETVTITPIPFDLTDVPFELNLSATANNGQIYKHIVDVKVLEFTCLSPNAGVPTTSDLTADLAPIEATWTPILATVDPILFPLAGLQAHKVMDVELSPITLGSSARAENPWQLEAILERIEGSLTGRQNVYGTINKNLRPITMSGESVYINILGQINATLNPIYLAEQMHANTWKAWSLAVALENITLSATGHQDVYGSIAQDLQAIGADIEIDSLVFEIIAMNLLNKAVTNFSNYPFNSFCYFNGKYFGCARDGIYELTGVSDYGTDIASYIKTGLLDLEVTALRRIRHAYLGFKSSGVLTLTITTDDGTSYSYTTENLTSNYQGQKVKFGKGFKDRYFQLKIANTDGCTFAIDKTRVFDEPISHRKR